jgi:membrane protease YdiL (CAAX protease family)
MRWTLARLAIFLVVLLALDVACQIAPQLLHLPWRFGGAAGELANAAGLAIAMIVAYRLLVRWVERRKATELAASGALPFTLAGIAGGAALFAAVFGVLQWQGVATLGDYAGAGGIPHALAIALASAVGEEIIFRGALFRIVEEGFGTFAGLVISAALFGLIHSQNHGATLVSTAAIAVEAGLFLAAAYAATRTLWVPIGLHFGWNFVEGGLFGEAVSGGQYHGLFKTTLSGPTIFTGGAFGPEASAGAVAASLAATLILLGVALARGRWEPARLRWQMEASA